MNDADRLWADPRLVYAVAAAAVTLLLVTVWLLRRRRKEGRQAAVVCLLLSIALHAALLWFVPLLPKLRGGGEADPESGDGTATDAIAFSTFDPDVMPDQISGEAVETAIVPLPVSELISLTQPDSPSTEDMTAPEPTPLENTPNELISDASESSDSSQVDSPGPPSHSEPMDTASSNVEPSVAELAEPPRPATPDMPSVFDEQLEALSIHPADALTSDLDQWLDQALDADSDLALEHQPIAIDSEADHPALTETPVPSQSLENRGDPALSSTPLDSVPPPTHVSNTQHAPNSTQGSAEAQPAMVPARTDADFANRSGTSKQKILMDTGGDVATEAAVEAALRFLAKAQRADGSWDPLASGAGRERAPLGMNRGNAGARAETAITGLALLSMIGAGNTHHEGPYADNVYRGLAYLIQRQHPSGSLAGNAAMYAANYSHGMASLAMCEAAAMTADASAIECSRRAIAYTQRMQHPTTGGWRYTKGDPGDLSQLGWQAMVLDAGYRAGIEIDRRSVAGVQRFLRSVRGGAYGGLASYRAGEAPSRTMTAEALATRLLIGETVPPNEIAEAERYLLQQPPGVGQDNYYYWYYATLALHQLQDDAWRQWNDALKRRLLATQRPDGSWSSDTLWGGYGGTIYTTSMATLCLETYYRHQVRSNPNPPDTATTRVANTPPNDRPSTE